MDDLIKNYFPVFFPVAFVLLWLTVTTLLGLLSGWYFLMEKYPDRREEPLLTLKGQSGMLGIVGLQRILNISVCPSGLRVGMMRIFGIFCRDFFVPWNEISISRKNRFFWQTAVLQFGHPPRGKLSVAVYVANRLARSAVGHWPEPGLIPEESKDQVLIGVIKEWAAITCFAALFFIVAPRLAFRNGAYPPLSVAILFPAVVFGIAAVFKYFDRIKR